jgi:hypothetical protein
MNFALFIQAFSLFCTQPLLLKQAQTFKSSSRTLLMWFLPMTVLATPLGQFVGDSAPIKILQCVGGVLITGLSLFELYQNRSLVANLLNCRYFHRIGLFAVTPNLPSSSTGSTEAALTASNTGALESVVYTNSNEKIFFMIGSQRSGSNWLRTMLDEREDLAGPHHLTFFEISCPF